MYVVVGSGPAGVSCAKGLLERGSEVTMIDAGLGLEPGRQLLVDKFSRQQPQQWSKADLEVYRAGMEADGGGVAVKLAYGSDFPYREVGPFQFDYSGVGLRPSYARGGLSNVWGAAIMPFAKRDMLDWPFGPETLEKHYQAVLNLTGLAAERDALQESFPLHTPHLTQLKPSTQAAHLLKRMEKNKAALAKAGILFGASRLAVRGNGAQEQGCNYCRLCMYGCPYGFIYNSSESLETLRRNPAFHYESGIVVESIAETPSGVRVSGRDISGQHPRTWDCERAFLAAGTIPTTRLLLHALGKFDQRAHLKDSQYFIMPMLMLNRQRGARAESLHALSQIFLEIFDENSSHPGAHVQVYSNNDLINDAVKKAFGPFQRSLAPMVHSLQDRLLVAQGFLHSDFSSGISVCLSKEQGRGAERLRLEAEINPSARGKIQKIVSTLLRHARKTGAIPILPLLKIGEPGRSFHTGGSFPMSRNPTGFQTDLQGRPSGFQCIHAVDATVFPSIPATTITLTVMANAHRIGSLAGAGDS